MKWRTSLFLALLLIVTPHIVSAHAVISPSKAPTQSYQDFSLSVPTEKDIPITAVRLLIPTQLTRATPFVKPGWTIKITKVGENVTEIEWSGGSIPPGQKDTFQFTSVTPKENASLLWKVYQTYKDGTTVAWDRDPKVASAEGKVENPYSVTEVREDVLPPGAPVQKESSNTSGIAIAALALAIVALVVAFRKSRTSQ